MEFIEGSCENEMILVFLKAEIDSKRFSQRLLDVLRDLGVRDSIIRYPDLQDEKENRIRKRIIAEYRGYGMNKDLFEDFPSVSRWEWVDLDKSDLEWTRYIDYDYWVELSGGSRYAKDAAKNIRNGIEIFGQNNQGFINAAEWILSGSELPPMILVADSEKEHLVVLEGHLRLTAYLLEPGAIPDKLRALLGYATSDELRHWGLWGLA